MNNKLTNTISKFKIIEIKFPKKTITKIIFHLEKKIKLTYLVFTNL